MKGKKKSKARAQQKNPARKIPACPAEQAKAAQEKQDAPSAASNGFLPKMLSAFNSIYQKTPVIPFLDRQASAIFFICMAVFIFLVVYVFLTTPPLIPQFSFSEAPLSKNAVLALLPGESYSYEVKDGQNSEIVRYGVSQSSDCAGKVVSETSGVGSNSFCISQLGNLISNGTILQTNAGLGGISILLFSPWMLAVSDDFSWNVETRVNAGGMDVSIPTSFRSQGKKTIAGREAYEILVQNELAGKSMSSTFFVDSEKRVLLSAVFGNVTVTLINAPFSLNRTAG